MGNTPAAARLPAPRDKDPGQLLAVARPHTLAAAPQLTARKLRLGRPSPAAESGQRGRPGRPTQGADAANALPAGPWLHVEADVEDVAFADDVGLALGAQQPLALGGVPAAGGDQLVVADHLGPDEATLQVGVDAAGSLRGGRAPADLPGPALVLAGGQERHQVEQPPGGADHLVQPAPLDAVLGQQGGRLAGMQLGDRKSTRLNSSHVAISY